MIYYYNETKSDRAESLGVLLYFYAQKGGIAWGKF